MPQNDITIITGVQIRAARALLGWSVADLADLSGVSSATIHRAEAAEREQPRMRVANLHRLWDAFDLNGVEIIHETNRPVPPSGQGVRLKRA